VKKPATNLPASVRQRLLNLATERKEDFGLVLTRYGLERFLYRLSVSPHRDSFVLKGALLSVETAYNKLERTRQMLKVSEEVLALRTESNRVVQQELLQGAR
jgi:hypothetical protein